MGPHGGRRRGGGRLWAQKGSGGHKVKGAMRGRGLHVGGGGGSHGGQESSFLRLKVIQITRN